jgi:hypothetical protein
METWSQRVEAQGAQLARASVEGMYADPFWEARYGAERARRFGGEDALFHVRYLVQALSLDKPSVMADYALWLRTLLVSRGMCTRHVDENFEGLAKALTAAGFAPETPPHAVVQAGRDALRYAEGPARAMQEEAASLARRVAGRLAPNVTVGERLATELQLHLSYLSDALAAGRPELFLEHCRWYAGFWPRRGFGELTFPAVLEALEAAVKPEEARAVLAAARAAHKETRP